MTSKEALEILLKIAYVEPGPTKEKFITYARETEHNKTCSELYNAIKQDLERLEKLEKENQDLKELYDLQSQLNLHRCKSIKELYEKNLKLEDENSKLKKVIEILKKQNEGQTISQEEYDLLKEYL